MQVTEKATKVVYKIMGSAFPAIRAVSRSSSEDVEQVEQVKGDDDRGGADTPLADLTNRGQGPLEQKDFEGSMDHLSGEVRAARNSVRFHNEKAPKT